MRFDQPHDVQQVLLAFTGGIRITPTGGSGGLPQDQDVLALALQEELQLDGKAEPTRHLQDEPEQSAWVNTWK